MIEPIKILGVPVHPMTMVQAVDSLEQRLLSGEQTFVVTDNAEIIMRLFVTGRSWCCPMVLAPCGPDVI